MVLWKEKNQFWKVEQLAHCFPVIIKLVFQRNTACSTGFSRRAGPFYSKYAYSAKLKKHTYLSKENHLI
jgi:hypothetical protein